MKKILVTGAGGYIGSVAAQLFLESGLEVVVIDNFITGFKKPLEMLKEKYGAGRFRFYEIDLTGDLADFFNQEKNIDAVVHYAASCSVDESIENPEKYFHNNIFSTLNLLEAMKNNNIKQLVFSSTCAVYGEAKSLPIDEEHPTSPTNPYGESKLMTEKIINWYDKIFDLKCVILRYFNVTGASNEGVIGDSKKPSSLLIQNLVRGALGIEPFYLTCPEVATPDKTPIRDYVNVLDLNEAHIRALEYLEKSSSSQIINIGTGSGHSVLQIVRAVEEITGFKFAIQKNNTRKGEYASMVASIEKAKNILGWQPKRDLKESVSSLTAWYKKHPQGWSS